MSAIEECKLYEVDGHLIVHVHPGRGEELRVHLQSHGIESRVSPLAERTFDRLELDAGTDRDVAQAILDAWER